MEKVVDFRITVSLATTLVPFVITPTFSFDAHGVDLLFGIVIVASKVPSERKTNNWTLKRTISKF